MDFKEGTTYLDSTATPGVVTLDEFNKLEYSSKKNDVLISYGLSPEEVKLYNDYERGQLETKHKNYEKSILTNRIEEIKAKIQNAQSNNEDDEKEKTFKSNQETLKPSRFVHPINNLEELKKDLFGHLDANNSDSYAKRRKLIRRMHRKFNQDLSLPEPKRKINLRNGSVGVDSCVESNSISAKPNSKWDMKHIDKTEPKISEISNKKDRVYGCSSNRLYTIADGKIIELKGKRRDISISNEPNINHENKLDGTKLTLEEIRSKFKNYEQGVPNKILFIKNISNNATIDDFKELFKENLEYESIRVMSGKMRGQAFATFNSIEGAKKSLEETNGLYFKGKPLIVQYGKNNT